LYLRDRVNGTTELVQVGFNIEGGLLGNGQHVLYNLNNTDYAGWLLDRSTGSRTIVTVDSGGAPSSASTFDASSDGRFVVWSHYEDPNLHRAVYVHDRDTDQDGIYDEPGQFLVTRMNDALGQAFNASSNDVPIEISDNGRYVALSSTTCGLAGPDTNQIVDAYFIDRADSAVTPHDRDCDGVLHISDNCPSVANSGQENQDGDEYGDACEAANCVNVVNHWTVASSGDADCDGYADTTTFAPRAPESTIGTGAGTKCSATAEVGDETLPDAWPPDFNDNQLVNGADVLHYNFSFGQPTTNPPVVIGGTPIPLTRFDLNGSGLVNGADVLQLNPFFGKRCDGT
jgi:hypothetical protein